MTDQERLQQAKEYIQAKRYGEARMVLRFMHQNETAVEWLAKLDQLDPPKPPPMPPAYPSTHSRPISPLPTPRPVPTPPAPRRRSLRDGATMLQIIALLFMAGAILGGVLVAISGSGYYQGANFVSGVLIALSGLAGGLFFYVVGGVTKILINIEATIHTQSSHD